MKIALTKHQQPLNLTTMTLYSVNVSTGNESLEISFVGYAAQEVPVKKRNNINVTLTECGNSYDEVVVMGYGKQRKATLTDVVVLSVFSPSDFVK